jgi:tRNA dimethylallyltransferase
MRQKKVILLVGPTAVGKTGASIIIAKELGAEIISADSMQIYKHMDIGTEKPAREQLREVRHHMIDIVEPHETFSAGRYMATVAPIIESLLGAGRAPLVVGGTGLYIKAMTRGLFTGPGADRELREELRKEDAGTLYERLRLLDPEAAGEIRPGDKRRVVRALEVCLKSGKKISELRKSMTSPLPCEFVKIGLTRERKELYRMIDGRVEGMVERGLLDEVGRLLEMNPSETPMQAIGYKEIAGHLMGEYPLDEAVRLIKRNTRRYAKRQFTWFRKEAGLGWVDLTGVHDDREAADRIRPLIKGKGLPGQ